MAKRSIVRELKGGPRKKGRTVEKEAHINSLYLDKTGDVFNSLQSSWRNIDQESSTIEYITRDPFPVCNLPEFLIEDSATTEETERVKGRSFIEELQQELGELNYHKKNNDLYQFSQSDDLKNCTTPCIVGFRHALEIKVLPWLRELTGIELSTNIAMTASRYEHTDRLLCHDDELEGRRIAFIYYLVPQDWTIENGGTLDLFNTDVNIRPLDIVNSVTPCRNSFLFFEVTSRSFHQVSEVLSHDKVRLSINGWFHGPTLPRPPPYMEPPPAFSLPKEMPVEVLEEWVNPMYLDIGVQSQIQRQFEEDSQIELPDFFLDDRYLQICKDVNSVDNWKAFGPPDKRCVVKATDIGSSSCSSLLNLFLSEPFCLLLSHLTGIHLSDRFLDPHAPVPQDEVGGASNSRQSIAETPVGCHGDVFLWKPGCYTLMSDDQQSCLIKYTLEAAMFFNVEDWSPNVGGVTNYILKNKDEELLNIAPLNNSLSLVYKDCTRTMSYVQYLNSRGRGRMYQSVSTVYVEGDQSSGCGSSSGSGSESGSGFENGSDSEDYSD